MDPKFIFYKMLIESMNATNGFSEASFESLNTIFMNSIGESKYLDLSTWQLSDPEKEILKGPKFEFYSEYMNNMNNMNTN